MANNTKVTTARREELQLLRSALDHAAKARTRTPSQVSWLDGEFSEVQELASEYVRALTHFYQLAASALIEEA